MVILVLLVRVLVMVVLVKSVFVMEDTGSGCLDENITCSVSSSIHIRVLLTYQATDVVLPPNSVGMKGRQRVSVPREEHTQLAVKKR